MKKPFFSLIIIALAVMTMSYAIHKHYISLTRIEYSQEDKALQITMRFFIDDLEKAVETQFNKKLQLATDDEIDNANVFIERYIEQKFKISVNNEPKAHSYLGKQYENDEVFFFLEISGIEQIENIAVTISMLFEVFEEQQNYVKLSLGELNKTFILVKANDKEMLNLTSPR